MKGEGTSTRISEIEGLDPEIFAKGVKNALIQQFDGEILPYYEVEKKI